MQTFESRIGKVPHAKEKIYAFLSDFTHFDQLIPEGQINNWQATSDSCNFNVPGAGEIGLKMIEKQPYELLKISGDNMAKVDFNLWIQIKEASPGDSRVKITLKADLNPMLKMVASKPLKQFLEILISHIEKFDYSAQT